MRRSPTAPGRAQRVLLPPESSEESEDDLDADPTFDPDQPQTSRLQRILETNNQRVQVSQLDEETDEGSGKEVRAVKWMDKRGVVIVSTFESAFPLTAVTRFDKTQSRNIEVTCPKAVITYNKFMGGVDLLDGLVAYYRIQIRSRKYYMRLVYHFIDMAVVNGCLLYRRDCKREGWIKKDRVDLLQFKSEIFGVLSYEGNVVKKRGHTSVDQEEAAYENKKKRDPSTPIPEPQVRHDGIGHWPIVGESRQRCKMSWMRGKNCV